MFSFLSTLLLALTFVVTNVHANVVPVGNGITVNCRLFASLTFTDCGPPLLTNPVTFAVPEAGLTEPSIEFEMELDFNVPFSTAFTEIPLTDILDPFDANGRPCPLSGYPLSCISDQLIGGNAPMDNGNGVIGFRSDPPNLIEDFGFFAGGSAGCIEQVSSGCSFSLDLGPVIVSFFSDDDRFTSPSSDLVTIIPTPEPPAILILGIGLGITALLRFARLQISRFSCLHWV
ncbi:MAG: hypothetical protein JO320_06505 [Alphaproteobacteria bacterium]|nr:hypothetical protein [Alphaproteobacteria bacterium]